jgi:hypothetical protein
MDAESQLRERMRGLVERLSEDLWWQDLRRGPDDQLLRGYLTRGPGAEPGWEFRFGSAVEGLMPGAVLRRSTGQERWRVTAVCERALDGQAHAWAAVVEPLSTAAEAPPPADLEGLLGTVEALLAQSALGPLDRADVAEALARLRVLAGQTGLDGVPERVALRLRLLRDRFKTCPQTGHSARGLILRLEAAFKRLGPT